MDVRKTGGNANGGRGCVSIDMATQGRKALGSKDRQSGRQAQRTREDALGGELMLRVEEHARLDLVDHHLPVRRPPVLWGGQAIRVVM